MGVTIRAPAAAVKAGRDRGPSVTHRRAKEQAAEAAAAEQKKAKKPSTKKARGAALGLAGVAAAGIVYGRVRLHSSPHSAVNATGEERRNSLMDKGWARRTVLVHGVTPSGDAVLEAERVYYLRPVEDCQSHLRYEGELSGIWDPLKIVISVKTTPRNEVLGWLIITPS